MSLQQYSFDLELRSSHPFVDVALDPRSSFGSPFSIVFFLQLLERSSSS